MLPREKLTLGDRHANLCPQASLFPWKNQTVWTLFHSGRVGAVSAATRPLNCSQQ